MDPISAGPQRGPDDPSCAGREAVPLLALARVLEQARDRAALGRALAAGMLHARSGACARAWWCDFDPAQGRLLPMEVDPSADAADLLEAARAAGLAAPRAEPAAPWSEQARGLDPVRLAGVAGLAWRAATPAAGPGTPDETPWAAAAWVAAVPVRGPAGNALLIGTWPTEPEPACVRAVEAVGVAGTLALAARLLAEETTRRTRTAAALAECTRLVASSAHLSETLHAVARLAAQATAARGSALWLAPDGRTAGLEVTFGAAGQRESIGRALQRLADATHESGRVRWIERALDEPLLGAEAAATIDNLVLLPLRAYDHALGVLAVYDRDRDPMRPGSAGGETLDALATFADLAALAIARARHDAERAASERQRRELQERVRREERLAVAGQIAADSVREVRQPLASIGAFARRVHRALADDDPHREYLEIVLRECERVESLVRSSVEAGASEPARLRIESLNAVLQEALQRAGETLVRRRVRLLKRLSPDVPPLLLDVTRMRQVVENVLHGALEAVPVGGRIRLESRRVGGFAVVDLSHDGFRQAGEMLDQLFASFGGPVSGATAGGLSLARQIVREHGGEIRLRTEPDWPCVFTFTLPIPDNEDRRRPGRDRRGLRHDRRTPTEPMPDATSSPR